MSLRVCPQCGALLKEKETQHTERSGVKRNVVEVRGFSENHHHDINDFLSDSTKVLLKEQETHSSVSLRTPGAFPGVRQSPP